MSTVAFRVHTSLRKAISQPLDVEAVLDRFASFTERTDGPDRIVHDEGQIGQPRTEGEIRKRLKVLVPALEAGQRLRVVSDDAQRFIIHAVEVDPPMADVPGVPAVKAWVAILRERWPNARLAGTCVCKDDSTSHCNGHNDCAACDDFDDMGSMREQRDYLVTNAEEMGVSYVILEDRIWTYGPPRTSSSRATRYYSGQFHYHLHASFIGGVCSIACRGSSEWP